MRTKKLFDITDYIIDHASKLEFLLVEVAILLIVFVVVAQSNPTIEAYETRELTALSVVWDMPTGYASFVDSGSKIRSCSSSSSTSCSTPNNTYWPGSSIIYTVKVINNVGASTILKEGGATANSSGAARASWSWRYAAVIWPNEFTSCAQAQTQCKTASNLTNLVQTFGELKPNSDYRVIVCAPDCGIGTKIVDRVQRTAIPAKLNTVVDSAMVCNGNKTNVNLTWTPAAGGVYDQQWIDYSVQEYFAPGYTQSTFLPVGQGSFAGVNFEPNTKYYWRVNSRLGYSANAWITSSTGVFTTKNCNQPIIITCETADVDRSGVVNVVDLYYLSLKSSAPYDPAYDLNKDGKVDNGDYLLAASKTGTCASVSYATKLVAKPTCTVLGPGNIVNVDFTWAPATSGVVAEQFLDFDRSTHGETGWPKSNGVQISSSRRSAVLQNFEQGDVTYYWRINTRIGNVWYGSAVKSFKTPKCEIKPEPKDLKVILTSTTQKPDGSICTDNPYAVTFSWTGQGSGWYLDVSVGNNNFVNYSNRDVSGRTSFVSTGSDFYPALTFQPGETYYWRMYYQVAGKWAVAPIPAFQVDYCNVPFFNEFPEGWPTATGVISQGGGATSHGVLEAIDITGSTGTLIKSTFDGEVVEVCIDGAVNPDGSLACNYGNLGNAVIVRNPNHGHLAIFGHLNAFLISNRSSVKKGQNIAGMGCTGYCTGTHVHYEYRGLGMGKPYIPVNAPYACNSEQGCGVSW